MTQISPDDEEVYQPRESRLSGEAVSYINILTSHAPGTIVFRTGSGRIFSDLLLHWPTLDGQEVEAQALCRRIVGAIYPLVGALYAQAVEISVMISAQQIDPPAHVDALSSYVLFDSENGVERLFFLSPHHDLPPADLMKAPKGIEVICRPLNYRYHTIKDDRPLIEKVRIGMYELPKRMLDDLYENHNFTDQELMILFGLITTIRNLNDITENIYNPYNNPLAVTSSLHDRDGPSTAHNLELLLMAYVVNKDFSPDFRLGLRRVAQSLRQMHPKAVIEEAAREELTPVVHRSRQMPRANLGMRKTYDKLKTASLESFPATILVGESGKLQSTARQRSRAWDFPTPGLAPFPQAPSFKANS